MQVGEAPQTLPEEFRILVARRPYSARIVRGGPTDSQRHAEYVRSHVQGTQRQTHADIYAARSCLSIGGSSVMSILMFVCVPSQELLAIPMIRGVKSPSERFAGGE